MGQLTDGHFTTISILLSNRLIKALGEIGLDRTEPQHTWLSQDIAFGKMLTLCRPDKVLVLHLWGASNKHSSDVLLSALHLVRKACLRNQPIHLHCFTGFQHDVEEWLQEFPNCFFGFTGKVSSFSREQLFGLQSVQRKDCSSRQILPICQSITP